MKTLLCLLVTFLLITIPLQAEEQVLSTPTQECIDCHATVHPGLYHSWLTSRHATMTPAAALQKTELERRISAGSLPESLSNVVVGCYECHSLNTDKHDDAFEHFGYKINIVVSPNDCATCHPVEHQQYAENRMAHAYGNLLDNVVYQQLIKSVNGHTTLEDGVLKMGDSDSLTMEESCLYCHGTKVEVRARITKDSDFGEYEKPLLTGWPNQGVGRINPDGSKGACSACHTRHAFSVEMARKPYTCMECHVGPDVPAYKVYMASKHGNIFATKKEQWEFNHVPWVVGKDFTAPTCAACHASLLVDADKTIIAERSHRFNNRLAWRLFGVIYAHPNTKAAVIKDIRNSQGLPLAVELSGEPVESFLIDANEQAKRNEEMQRICRSCHHTDWVVNHFNRLDNTIKRTNEATLTATSLMATIWQENLAQGLPQGANLFDEYIERIWAKSWLFYANSTRFTSAMAGGGDYGVFANGRFQLSETLMKMQDWYDIHKQAR